MAKLYIVSTPIGNLKDISFRALETLREVDLILGEDTRTTKKLLNHYNIDTLILSYHQHSKIKKINQILDYLKQNKDTALVSDAGTPGISDPGNQLISEAIKLGVEIVSIPGASALSAAASVCHFAMDRFLFLGFIPQKKKRNKFLEKISLCEYPVIFYESPYRIIKTLKDLESFDLELVVCREITKKFETIYRGSVKEILNQLTKDQVRGEFTVVAKKK